MQRRYDQHLRLEAQISSYDGDAEGWVDNYCTSELYFEGTSCILITKTLTSFNGSKSNHKYCKNRHQ